MIVELIFWVMGIISGVGASYIYLQCKSKPKGEWRSYHK